MARALRRCPAHVCGFATLVPHRQDQEPLLGCASPGQKKPSALRAALLGGLRCWVGCVAGWALSGVVGPPWRPWRPLRAGILFGTWTSGLCCFRPVSGPALKLHTLFASASTCVVPSHTLFEVVFCIASEPALLKSSVIEFATWSLCQ